MENLNKYQSAFSVVKLWKKLTRLSGKLGIKVVYTILLLFYAYRRKDTPSWAKRVVIGTLGYFLSPIDAIPDLTPFVGYTDDIGILSLGMVTIAAYINKDVKAKARGKLSSWFKSYKEEDLADVDEQL